MADFLSFALQTNQMDRLMAAANLVEQATPPAPVKSVSVSEPVWSKSPFTTMEELQTNVTPLMLIRAGGASTTNVDTLNVLRGIVFLYFDFKGMVKEELDAGEKRPTPPGFFRELRSCFVHSRWKEARDKGLTMANEDTTDKGGNGQFDWSIRKVSEWLVDPRSAFVTTRAALLAILADARFMIYVEEMRRQIDKIARANGKRGLKADGSGPKAVRVRKGPGSLKAAAAAAADSPASEIAKKVFGHRCTPLTKRNGHMVPMPVYPAQPIAHALDLPIVYPIAMVSPEGVMEPLVQP